MLVAITYHEDFGKHGFSVLKERIRPSFEALMESGIVDGEEIQVFKPSPAPLRLVRQAHTKEHMDNMADRSLQRCGHIICRKRYYGS